MPRDAKAHTWKHHVSTEDLTRRLGLDTADFYFTWRGGSSAGSATWRAWTKVLAATSSDAIVLWVAHPSGRAAPRVCVCVCACARVCVFAECVSVSSL